MTSSPGAPGLHPLLWFAGRIAEVLDQIGEPPLWSLSPREVEEVVTGLSRVLPRIQAQLLRVVAYADTADVATASGGTSTAAWLRLLTHDTAPAACRLVKTAQALEGHEQTRAALAAGSVTLDQASVVLAAVEALPAGHREAGEAHLLAAAQEHDAKELKLLGRHLLEVLDPDSADEVLAEQLRKEEAAADRACRLELYDDGKGRTHGRFTIPARHGAMLRTMTEALCNPALPTPIERAGRTRPDLLGQAFCQLLERYPVDRLPHTGGVNATVVVTIPLATLEGRLESAGLVGTGVRRSPGEARRLACAAGVIPAVLDGDSVVVDWGRHRRLHTQAQRVALAVQQKGVCGIRGCDRPAGWCDAHHLKAWSQGGRTSVDNGALLCPRHHTLSHSDHLTLVQLGTGRFQFHRRT